MGMEVRKKVCFIVKMVWHSLAYRSFRRHSWIKRKWEYEEK